MIFTWRPSDTAASLGKRISEEERKSLETKYRRIVSPEALNEFLQALPRDLIFVFRTTDLLRGLNKDLGGTSRLRLTRFGEEAVKGLRLPVITSPSEYTGKHISNPESQFREYLKHKCINGPDTLDLNMPHAPVNRLVSSECAKKRKSRLDWLVLLKFRLRVFVVETYIKLAWYWRGQKSYTSRDVG